MSPSESTRGKPESKIFNTPKRKKPSQSSEKVFVGEVEGFVEEGKGSPKELFKSQVNLDMSGENWSDY